MTTNTVQYLTKDGLSLLWNKIVAKLAGYATTDDIPTKTSQLTNDSFGTIANYNVSFLTQSAYNALTTKDTNTIYFIKEG
jgi:hypothetical protein